MKIEDNWKSKTLESLEKKIWPSLDPEESTYLIRTCSSLRKKPLQDFTTEDLRIMIGQNIGLKYLIPIAIETLESNILAEGDYFEGDLLQSVLKSDKRYWELEKENRQKICKIFDFNKIVLQEFDTTKDIRKDIFDAFHNFKLTE
ncbi:contact-dependent growth inhibition system immunity protein [Rufibacter roseolus]|uniref:contact-dependent growth inhibition system immunity protein n=1 Tax=Rufibacter roseolus TaxID=2817375 RepID=UPI001B30E00C|nr:contact-dependent growth inhibition system immunity protein [Rufibacter roseolus]